MRMGDPSQHAEGAEHSGEPAPQTGNVSHVTEHHGCSS